MAIRFDILESAEFFIGTDQPVNLNVKQSDESTAQTMTGWALSWVITSVDKVTTHVTKTVGSGITIQNGVGTDDQAAIQVDAADTASLSPGTYRHQLIRTDAGSVRVLTFGKLVMLLN